ncbi:hypothetical protein KGQ20_04135 [Catenulispora sp. NF23]|uniref:DUF7715 domain-containing protein n=1 Tax=Catenulispora pinistramenti TaxID=2705254 RepID=A0ABS5KJS8_9ACTN|nr:hypothetical protein [Catenulispora pinistramenti]MBS2531953.1 hypothetical protein [Catenulispora pinistramenti]MBS2546220.1 hypothetical protein [Catenulispora pinistramenti]
MARDYVPAASAQPPVFTVTVAGPERHDGEAPYTYVMHAADERTARALALAYHAASHELRIVGFRIDNRDGPVWRSGFDPAIRPDVVHVPRHSFPGAPAWPDDTPGQAWRDMRPAAEQARIATTLVAEFHRLEVARDFGLDVADMDIGRSEAPAVPARDAVLHVMQLRARRALSPGRPPTEGADTIPIILGTAHIRALTTAICDLDLANGVEPDDVGQVLTDANYTAASLAADTDEDPPPYFHHRLDVDQWPLLKAADCYLFQIRDVGNEAAVAAHNAAGRVRTELIKALGVDADDYRMRFEWDAADGWPLLHAVPAPVRRAEALIEHYQQLDHTEELSTPDWGQHISDMIADLLHYAHGTAMDPVGLLDTGLIHFHAETRGPDTQPEPKPAEAPVLRLLVATSATQGREAYDFCRTLPGEIVYPGPCLHPQPFGACGCTYSLMGVDSLERTTTFEVAEVPISREELLRVLAKAESGATDGADAAGVAQLAEEMLALAERFPLAAVLGRTHRRYRRRPLASAPPTAPPPTPAPEDDEPKQWTVRVSMRRDHEYTVEAVDEDGAMNAAWDAFDEDRNIVDQDTDVSVRLAA